MREGEFLIDERTEEVVTGDTMRHRKIIRERVCPKCDYDRFLVKEYYLNGYLKSFPLRECMNPDCDYCIDDDGEIVNDSAEKAIAKTMF